MHSGDQKKKKTHLAGHRAEKLQGRYKLSTAKATLQTVSPLKNPGYNTALLDPCQRSGTVTQQPRSWWRFSVLLKDTSVGWMLGNTKGCCHCRATRRKDFLQGNFLQLFINRNSTVVKQRTFFRFITLHLICYRI